MTAPAAVARELRRCTVADTDGDRIGAHLNEHGEIVVTAGYAMRVFAILAPAPREVVDRDRRALRRLHRFLGEVLDLDPYTLTD